MRHLLILTLLLFIDRVAYGQVNSTVVEKKVKGEKIYKREE
jgi:hypothetical protein